MLTSMICWPLSPGGAAFPGLSLGWFCVEMRRFPCSVLIAGLAHGGLHPRGNIGGGNEVLPSPATIQTRCLAVQGDGKGIFFRADNAPPKMFPRGATETFEE